MTKEDDRARRGVHQRSRANCSTRCRADLVEFEAQGKNVRPEVLNKIFRGSALAQERAGRHARLRRDRPSPLAQTRGHARQAADGGRSQIAPQDLIASSYDSVDGPERGSSSPSTDPSLSGLVDASSPTSATPPSIARSRISRRRRSRIHSRSLTLDEQTKKSPHRIRRAPAAGERPRPGKYILSVEQTFDFSDFDESSERLTAGAEGRSAGR